MVILLQKIQSATIFYQEIKMAKCDPSMFRDADIVDIQNIDGGIAIHVSDLCIGEGVFTKAAILLLGIHNINENHKSVSTVKMKGSYGEILQFECNGGITELLVIWHKFQPNETHQSLYHISCKEIECEISDEHYAID